MPGPLELPWSPGGEPYAPVEAELASRKGEKIGATSGRLLVAEPVRLGATTGASFHPPTGPFLAGGGGTAAA